MAKGWTCARPRRPLSWAQRLISPTSAGSPCAGLSLAQFGCACDSWRWQGTWHPLTAPRHICFLVRAPPLLVYELQPFRRACLGARCIRLCWHTLASSGEIFGTTDRHCPARACRPLPHRLPGSANTMRRASGAFSSGLLDGRERGFLVQWRVSPAGLTFLQP